MEHCKLQIGCMVVLLYLTFIFIKERKTYRLRDKQSLFAALLFLGVFSVALDGITAYTVNHLEQISPAWNLILHALFLFSLDAVIFMLCLYMLVVTGAFPEKKRSRALIFAPFLINAAVLILSVDSLQYISGKITNYSMGLPAYTCFIMAGIYEVLTIAAFIRRWNDTESHKRASILTYLLVLAVGTGIQMVFPETLITSIGVTVFILGIYLNLEDPALKELSHYHDETVMAFANLIENRDDSTGGHVKRTSQYVSLIAKELQAKKEYRTILTKDYITNLVKAAPMHDIGKIAIPDAILQKPGKLTEEEFSIMKQHSEKGGEIIREAFQNLGSEEYRQMAYEVARFHHEKWNGKGYPEGHRREGIPLCARIMAVADVFYAVSEKRCYRDALPLDECFEIIRRGSGQDFDPDIVEVFLNNREKVEKLYGSYAAEPEIILK